MKLKKINMIVCVITVMFGGIYNCHAMVDGIWVENDKHFIVDSKVRVIPKNGLDGNNHKMEKLTIPETVERVQTGAMCNANHLKYINIGAHEVEPNAFLMAESLLEVRVMASVAKLPVGITDISKVSKLLKSDDVSELNNLLEPGKDTPRLLNGSNERYDIGVNPVFFVDAKNMVYSSDRYGSLYNKEKTVLISFPSSIQGTFVTPSTVQYICARCFHDANISNLVVTDNVKSVNSWMFDLKYHIPRPFNTSIEIGLPQKILGVLDDYKTILSCKEIYSLVTVYETPSDYNKLSELWFSDNDYNQFHEIMWPYVIAKLHPKMKGIDSRAISISNNIENTVCNYLEYPESDSAPKPYKDQAAMLCIDAREIKNLFYNDIISAKVFAQNERACEYKIKPENVKFSGINVIIQADSDIRFDHRFKGRRIDEISILLNVGWNHDSSSQNKLLRNIKTISQRVNGIKSLTFIYQKSKNILSLMPNFNIKTIKRYANCEKILIKKSKSRLNKHYCEYIPTIEINVNNLLPNELNESLNDYIINNLIKF